ncbi:NADPH-dependent F420 reductase [Streptomyces sp. NPDC048644]|uniref:NADPH-dependent F420 reductase n=1 Tax=Streptomyces sp. NPDC048644 TaxID=3365582 RepID=UPI0037104D6A
MTTLGIIGSGLIGSAVARLAVAAGMDVVVANSRGPETLAGLVGELGERSRAGTAQEAAEAGDHVVLSIPLGAYRNLPVDALAGKVVLATSNYYPARDGRIEELDEEKVSTGEFAQQRLAGVKLVRAFNDIGWTHIPQLARPAGAADRSALPIAGDDAGARAEATALIGKLGYDTVDVGALADSWRFERQTQAYSFPYAAIQVAKEEDLVEAPVAPLSSAALKVLLDQAHRPPVAELPY